MKQEKIPPMSNRTGHCPEKTSLTPGQNQPITEQSNLNTRQNTLSAGQNTLSTEQSSLSAGQNNLSPEQKKQIANRLARTIGHLKKVRSMVEEGADCPEVLIQLSAVKSAISHTGNELLKIQVQQLAQGNADPQRIRDLQRTVEMMLQ